MPLQRGGQRAAEMNEFQHWFPEREYFRALMSFCWQYICNVFHGNCDKTSCFSRVTVALEGKYYASRIKITSCFELKQNRLIPV